MDDRGDSAAFEGVLEVGEAEDQSNDGLLETSAKGLESDAPSDKATVPRDALAEEVEDSLDESLDSTVVISEEEMEQYRGDAVLLESDQESELERQKRLEAIERISPSGGGVVSKLKEQLVVKNSLLANRLSGGVKVSLLLLVGCAAGYGVSQLSNNTAGSGAVVSAGTLQELAPAKGGGLLTDPAQVHYCLAQGIRFDAASKQAASLGGATTQRLQLLLRDYDQRCGGREFDAGVLAAANQAVAARRGALEAQGLAVLQTIQQVTEPAGFVKQEASVAPVASAKNDLDASVGAEVSAVTASAQIADAVVAPEENAPVAVEDSSSAAEAAPVVSATQAPAKLIKDLQWRLYKLGFFNGNMNGVYAASTERAVKAFYADHSELAVSSDHFEIYSVVDKVYASR